MQIQKAIPSFQRWNVRFEVIKLSRINAIHSNDDCKMASIVITFVGQMGFQRRCQILWQPLKFLKCLRGRWFIWFGIRTNRTEFRILIQFFHSMLKWLGAISRKYRKIQSSNEPDFRAMPLGDTHRHIYQNEWGTTVKKNWNEICYRPWPIDRLVRHPKRWHTAQHPQHTLC